MRVSLLFAALAFATTPVTSSAQDAPDFSGKWKLDTARSVGPVNPPPPEVSGRSARTEPPARSQRTGMAGGSRRPAAGGAAPLPAAAQQQRPETIEQELSVRVDGTRFRIEQVTNGRKETFQFALDGAESKNKYYVGREAVELPTTTQWDGRKLVTSSSTMANTSRGRIPVVFSETRYLSEDGAEMIVESRLQSTAGSFERKLVYVKM